MSVAARNLVAVAAGAILVVGGWQLLVVAGDYPHFILPGPVLVAQRLVAAWADGTLARHAAATLSEVVLGFAAGAVVAFGAGYLLARSRLAGLVLSPYLVAAQSTPILALAPLIALWFGTGLLSKVVICALIVFFPIAVSTMVGFRTVDPGLVEVARALRATPAQILRTVELPAALPQIFGGIRVGVTLAIIGAVVAEWAGAEVGLGILILTARGSFDIPLVFASLVTIAGLGVALYGLVVLTERLATGPRG
ncbi:MAG TPA: ABC transporter permease [Candidatus Limnocylindrales bacterium]|nr:ABC transporter permease [Candidatus Limnocylindrales bacterium]